MSLHSPYRIESRTQKIRKWFSVEKLIIESEVCRDFRFTGTSLTSNSLAQGNSGFRLLRSYTNRLQIPYLIVGLRRFCSTITPVADCELVQGGARIIYVANFASLFLNRDQVIGKLN
jgi:hypothetical protein